LAGISTYDVTDFPGAVKDIERRFAGLGIVSRMPCRRAYLWRLATIFCGDKVVGERDPDGIRGAQCFHEVFAEPNRFDFGSDDTISPDPFPPRHKIEFDIWVQLEQ